MAKGWNIACKTDLKMLEKQCLIMWPGLKCIVYWKQEIFKQKMAKEKCKINLTSYNLQFINFSAENAKFGIFASLQDGI